MRGRTPGGLGALAFVPLVAAWPAFAEPSDQAVRMARKRFQEGVVAVDAGNYEAARVAFQQAYALKPHPSVLRNLGQAELKTGRYLEAARHLSTFVRDTTYGTALERESAAKSLAQAETQVGRVLVQVDVPGANITIDGELAGRSPVSDPFYAEPGERVIRIQREGYEPYEKTQLIEAGRTTQLKIALDAAATPAAAVSRYAGPFAPGGDGTDTEVPGPPPAGLVARSGSEGGGRTIALVTAGGLVLVAAGVWIGFALQGASLQSDADDLRIRLDPKIGCQQETPTCAELRDVSHRRATANTVALVGAVTTGVSAAAFAAAYFLWPKSRTVARAEVLPALSSGQAGFELRATF
jgi:putative intracellular protease/amidase